MKILYKKLEFLSKRPLHKSACLEKTAHFDEISITSEPTYAGRPIAGERESKDREMGVFNKHADLCDGLSGSSVRQTLHWKKDEAGAED